MSAAPSAHEAFARARKAQAITSVLIAKGVSADDAELLDETGWRIAAELAGVRPPSELTWEQVVKGLRVHEHITEKFADAPFAGLPGYGSQR